MSALWTITNASSLEMLRSSVQVTRWRFVLLSKQLRTLAALFERENLAVRICAVSGNYTTDAQRTPIRKEDGFTQYQVSSQEFDVNWKTESWNDAIWLSDYVKKVAFPERP